MLTIGGLRCGIPLVNRQKCAKPRAPHQLQRRQLHHGMVLLASPMVGMVGLGSMILACKVCAETTLDHNALTHYRLHGTKGLPNTRIEIERRKRGSSELEGPIPNSRERKEVYGSAKTRDPAVLCRFSTASPGSLDIFFRVVHCEHCLLAPHCVVKECVVK